MICAAIFGSLRESGRLQQYTESLVPAGEHFRILSNNDILCFQGEDESSITSYIRVGESSGYSGPLEVAVRVDTVGKVLDIAVVSQKETPTYFKKVMKANFLNRLTGKSYADPFESGEDYDAISGATHTSAGIAGAVRTACRHIADSRLDMPAMEASSAKIKFGMPEITLVAVYLLVLFGLQVNNKYKKTFRWITLSIGLMVFGFWFSVPLSLGKTNMFLLGYFPEWQTGLYWYMLIFSVFGLILIYNKNWYCNWICPFLATQECLALIGGRKIKIPWKWQRGFSLFQRTLTWAAVVTALYFQTPVKINFELFGVFFNLTGSVFLFSLLGLFLIASMFVKRPYCKILCPVNAINDFLMASRSWITGGASEATQPTRFPVSPVQPLIYQGFSSRLPALPHR